MFCSQCGTKAEGKFCYQCGAPLAGATSQSMAMTPTAPPQAGDEPLTVLPADWADEVHYETVMRVPEVRERIERHAKLAPKRVSGEDLLAIFDKVASPNIPTQKLAAIAQPIYAALGIGTGKRRAESVNAPVGRALVRVLCSLARRGQPLRTVRQAEDGCMLEASLPSDAFALEGDLVVSIRRHGQATEVEAATRIKGQLYDWGKSKRCLNTLFEDLQAEAA